MPEAVRKMMPTIKYLAKKVSARGAASIEDLIQVGAMAAIDALNRFDPKKGRVWNFLRQRAHGAMIDELRNLDHISRIYRIRGHINGRPLPETLSLQTSPMELVPRVLPDKRGESPTQRSTVHDFWTDVRGHLNAREARALVLYYAGDMTLKAVAAAMGISESRACQIVGGAVRRLRKTFANRIRRNA